MLDREGKRDSGNHQWDHEIGFKKKEPRSGQSDITRSYFYRSSKLDFLRIPRMFIRQSVELFQICSLFVSSTENYPKCHHKLQYLSGINKLLMDISNKKTKKQPSQILKRPPKMSINEF